MYDTLLDALRRGDAATALPAARDLAAERPDDATAQRLLGAALRLSGDATGALAVLDAALARMPENAELHLERAGALLATHQVEQARTALTETLTYDPNQFGAYVAQAHLAIMRGELDDAERLLRTAERLAPQHPRLLGLHGLVALRRGQADRGLALLHAAVQQAPGDPVLRHALGLAHVANGHLAFAEQAFRGLLDEQPGWQSLRVLLADLVRRQARPDEALTLLQPALDTPDPAPAVRRMAGELQLALDRPADALMHLGPAFDAEPDQATLAALVEAWDRTGAKDEARHTLEQALAIAPDRADLWHARLAFEPFAGEAARAIVERWLEAMPGCVPALQAQATILDAHGDRDGADAIAWQILGIEPGHLQAELRVLESLMRRDPQAAVDRLRGLLAQDLVENLRPGLRRLLGRALDLAGQADAAVQAWTEVNAGAAPDLLALPAPAGLPADLPPLAPRPDSAPGVLLLWGAPGSLVERLVITCAAAGGPLRDDRFGPTPPADPLQSPAAGGALLDGRLGPAELVERWRAALPARGIPDGTVLDWLPWWDNALLVALRPHLPEAVLMIAVRDPRDMLLDWLVFGSPVPLALESPQVGAAWLAMQLGQVAELHERDLFPHRLLHLDAIAEDPQAIAEAIGVALDTRLAPASRDDFGIPHFPPGRWRAFATPLKEAFDLLTPVAVRLGYAPD